MKYLLEILRNIFPRELTITINDETQSDLILKIQPLLDELINEKNKSLYKNILLSIIIPENYSKTLYDRSTYAEQQVMDDYGIPSFNANFIAPKDNSSNEYTILFKADIFESFQYISSIEHEVTHFFDFVNYFNQYGNILSKDEQVKNYYYYYEFYLWTEFNAKKKGLLRLKKELEKSNSSINLIQSANIFKTDVINEFHNLRKLYHLMHFFARICIHDNFLITRDEKIYPKEFLSDNYDNYEIIYTILCVMNTYDDFQKEKEFFREVINL